MLNLSNVFDWSLTISYYLGFHAKNGHSILYNCYFFVSFFIIMLPLLILQFVNLFLIEREVIVIVNALMNIIIPSVNGITKVLVFFWHSDSVRNIIVNIDDPQFNPDFYSIKNASKIRRALREVEFITKALLLAILTTCTLIIIYNPINNYKTLPVTIWLPFDYTQDFVYETTN